MDILEFYGLKEDPFKLTPDPLYYFPSVIHSEALLSMNYVVQQREGFCLVTGEPGTGKTTLLNVFKENWKDKAEIALILTPSLSPDEFLVSVLEDLGVKPAGANKNDILKAFRDFLLEKSHMGEPVIIIVDEAQNLPDETLEELRLLSNLETDKDKLIQIILIGQTELERRLNSENLRQLNQRITVKVRLSPLPTNETLEYINFRLIKAGKGFLKLSERLLKPVHKFSGGIPRIINILSSRAIMSAYLDGSNVVTRKHVRYAIMHLKNMESPKIQKAFLSARIYILSLLGLLAIGGTIGYYYYSTSYNALKHKKNNVPPVSSTHFQESAHDIKGVGPVESRQKDIKTIEEPKKDGKTVTVIVESANLRSEPSVDSQRVAWASKGVVLEIVDEFTESSSKKWYKVKLSDGRQCWIADSVVTLLPP